MAPEIVLTSDERAELTKLVRSSLTGVRLAQHARIVLLTAQGMQNQGCAWAESRSGAGAGVMRSNGWRVLI